MLTFVNAFSNEIIKVELVLTSKRSLGDYLLFVLFTIDTLEVVDDFKYIIDTVFLLFELEVKISKLLRVLLYITVVGRES